MARIRAVKPGFFKNHALYIAEKESKLPLRLAYEGLWCVADREGRFKWKPEEIKTDVLPYDEVDMSAVLDALVRYKFIFKYKCDGEDYGFIPTFLEHQHVNKNEAPSTIPAPPKNSNARAKRVNARKAPVVAPSKHHEELVSGVREQEGEDDDDARATLSRVCKIWRVELQADPERITWFKQIEEMLRDGLTDTEIIAAAEETRTHGKNNLAYLRAVAFNAKKPKPAGGNTNGSRPSRIDNAILAARDFLGESGGVEEAEFDAGARGGTNAIAPSRVDKTAGNGQQKAVGQSPPRIGSDLRGQGSKPGADEPPVSDLVRRSAQSNRSGSG